MRLIFKKGRTVLFNADQADSDNDGLGDACDAELNVQNFIMMGHFLTLGGRSVDDNHTLKSKHRKPLVHGSKHNLASGQ